MRIILLQMDSPENVTRSGTKRARRQVERSTKYTLVECEGKPIPVAVSQPVLEDMRDDGVIISERRVTVKEINRGGIPILDDRYYFRCKCESEKKMIDVIQFPSKQNNSNKKKRA